MLAAGAALATASGAAFAQDERLVCVRDMLDAVSRHFGDAAGMEPLAAACKPWPFDRSITLLAAAWVQESGPSTYGERLIDLDVAMLDLSGAVLAAHRRELEEDAMLALFYNALRLDTARYDLAPGRRAFGVVVSSSVHGPSCPDRGFEGELTLFLRDGSALTPVLTTFLRTWEFVEGSPCSQTEPLVTETAQVTLHVEPTRSHGLADIRLQAAVERERYDWDGNVATAKGKRVRSRTLTFDGQHYQSDPFARLFFWTNEGNERD